MKDKTHSNVTETIKHFHLMTKNESEIVGQN